ncbi:Mitochondrial ATPase complex subunit atp10 [Apophysomyces sp. BC1034]|nr:Mitochondrial ATPase complex subunit atp10 [Apophysomyces sp. BC1015]KAG0179674.1 Mitochondrial ATPase complex subunit atp10 [Apophysomyces sp. BC1021]KAG0190169.1 Mitochondrial ATPase complex subunit atp10 [Apophysomyces sp. BC1034]
MFTKSVLTVTQRQIIQRSVQRHTAIANSRYQCRRLASNTAPAVKPKWDREPPSVLGVRDPPVVAKDSWLQQKKQKFKDMTDYEKAFAAHAAERRHLVEEATKSYFADVHEMRQHGGKMYHASNKLIKAEKACYMPDFEGSNLSKKNIHTTDLLHGKISLMSFVYSKSGEPHVNSFIEPFMKRFAKNEQAQLVEASFTPTIHLNVQENFLKQLLLKAFVPTIRNNLAEERKENYVLLLKDISRTRKLLDMTNQYIGYVYLVDENCKIRWTAHGEATPEELANMLAMTDYLIEKRS